MEINNKQDMIGTLEEWLSEVLLSRDAIADYETQGNQISILLKNGVEVRLDVSQYPEDSK